MMARVISTCREARDALLEALSGTTPPELRQALTRHLEACAECRREAAALEATAGLLRSVPEPRVSQAHWDDFMARLDRALTVDRAALPARLRRWLRSPRHAWSTAAAVAAVLVTLALALLGGPAPQALAPAPQTQAIQGFMTESIVEAQPAMNGSLSVWKAGFGAGDVPYDTVGGP